MERPFGIRKLGTLLQRIMKHLSALLLAFVALSASAQTEVFLSFTHLFDGDDYAQFTSYTTPDGYEVEFSRMQYYMCDFVITHDGGQETALTDTYLLVNAHLNSSYSLGSWDGIASIEGIAFAIGVDEANNHEDPVAWPSDHPLAPQNPSMHWGWASGYRFLAYEGTGAGNTVEIHALGDENFFSQSHEASVEAVSGVATIDLFADYVHVFNNMDVSNGLINHGFDGEVLTALENFRDLVFSTDASVHAKEVTTPAFAMFPNPATDVVRLSGGNNHEVELLDLSGRVVGTTGLFNGSASINVSELPAGVYLARIAQNGQAVRTERLVVR